MMQRPFAPAAERNRDPILGVLQDVLPPAGRVLELASGTGQHAVHFATALPGIQWQPSDTDEESLAGIEAWRKDADAPNLAAPVRIDVHERPWPVSPCDAIVCINMIHIAPWSATLALLEGAAEVLRPGGILFLYGPYRIGGQHTAPSNEAFDAQLRARDSSWGVRDLEAVVERAADRGLQFERRVAMPANNFSLVLRRQEEG